MLKFIHNSIYFIWYNHPFLFFFFLLDFLGLPQSPIVFKTVVFDVGYVITNVDPGTIFIFLNYCARFFQRLITPSSILQDTLSFGVNCWNCEIK
jgi:hypothetical protein